MNLEAIHGRRITIMTKDIQVLTAMCGLWYAKAHLIFLQIARRIRGERS